MYVCYTNGINNDVNFPRTARSQKSQNEPEQWYTAGTENPAPYGSASLTNCTIASPRLGQAPPWQIQTDRLVTQNIHCRAAYAFSVRSAKRRNRLLVTWPISHNSPGHGTALDAGTTTELRVYFDFISTLIKILVHDIHREFCNIFVYSEPSKS